VIEAHDDAELAVAPCWSKHSRADETGEVGCLSANPLEVLLEILLTAWMDLNGDTERDRRIIVYGKILRLFVHAAPFCSTPAWPAWFSRLSGLNALARRLHGDLIDEAPHPVLTPFE
jgi:hypothetical protein